MLSKYLYKPQRTLDVSVLPRHNRYAQVMLLLKQGAKTNAQLRSELGMIKANVAKILRRMEEQGLITVEQSPGTTRAHCYRWVANEGFMPRDALRQWEDRVGRYQT